VRIEGRINIFALPAPSCPHPPLRSARRHLHPRPVWCLAL